MSNIYFQPNWDVSSISVPPVRPLVQAPDDRIPVIIAEDDPVSRTLVTAVIEKGGFRAIVTCDGNEAMTALRNQKDPAIAVLDWMMPGMDGAEMCRRIREAGRNVYIIMLSARGSKEDTIEGMDHGADDYMVKPFNHGELLARIRAGTRQLVARAALQVRVEKLEGDAAVSKLLKFDLPL